MTMPQTRHYEMKDSGVEWIGKMPSHWEMSKMKRVLRNASIKGHPEAQVLSLYREYGVIPKDSRNDNHNVTSEDTASYKYVEAGDLVINKMKAWQGSLGLSQYEGIVSPAYYVCKVNSMGIVPRYLHHLIRSKTYAQEFERLSTGMRIGQWDLGIDDFLRVPLLLPPFSEQTAIAAYLDKKCATIDAIVSEAKASIEEYKSWKASVIFETVTKGLNPNAEMKDSGVEWIGRVSKGWKIVPAKFFMRVQAGYPFDSERFDNSQGIPLIRIRDITSGHTETFYNGDYPEEYVVHNNDLLVGMDGDFNVRWWQGGEAVLNQRCCRIFAQKGLILRYFYFLLPFYLKQVNELAYSTTVKHLANGDIGNADICLPPEDEQTAIAAYLDSKCAAIDGVILEKEDLIRELENYKRSLIFEVVTGKRRVC